MMKLSMKVRRHVLLLSCSRCPLGDGSYAVDGTFTFLTSSKLLDVLLTYY